MFQMSGSKLQLIDIVPMFILWGILSGVAFFLLYRKQMKKTYSLILYGISLIVGGIILGGIPNAVMPIQQILFTITMGNPVLTVLPMIIILILLLAMTLVIGRTFCGYACPLGALQELISKVQFKTAAKKSKRGKFTIAIPKKIQLGFRGVLLIVFFIVAIFWSMNLLQIFNPFLGFSLVINPLAFVFWIPLIFLGITIIASLFVYRPWCTLACPFGAIANLTSRLSRYKLVRTDDCTDCGLCEQICPTQEAGRDDSKGECYLCNRCAEICPQDAVKISK
ncbi:MAG: 4Fe-4S binding protein [Candidatus Lokiarchaeota archaeon]|nr:4Fe-4S binding protein [Candidatus Lokiarchaeota archaeon]